jgi:Calcium-dependent channel, 7TM region, putative phosphate
VVTARDAAAFMAPASIRYGRELGVIMLVFITGWAYAVVSPLVVVVSAIYFMSSWIVWRWQVVYVYVRCYEGGGSLWRSIVNCIMLCLYTCVFFTSCVFGAKGAFYQASFVLPLTVIIAVFWCALFFCCTRHVFWFVVFCAAVLTILMILVVI